MDIHVALLHDMCTMLCCCPGNRVPEAPGDMLSMSAKGPFARAATSLDTNAAMAESCSHRPRSTCKHQRRTAEGSARTLVYH